MDTNAAKRIVRETLQSSFDKNRFKNFVLNLFNHIDEFKAFHARGYVKEMFKQQAGVIKTYERLGTYTDPEGKKLDVLIVYLERNNSIDSARTTLRNFAAYYLKQRDEKEAGLFAFVSPNLDDWRLSFVKMEYNLQKVKGKVRPKAEFTPARRYSFLVGKNESSHTAQKQLLPILEDDEHGPTLTEFEQAFNIEIVTKEFFGKYRELFLEVKDALDKVLENDSKIKQEFSNKAVETADFAKKLLGQVVFLYFLQKKGWFGVKKNQEWGTGSKTFLRDLFDGKIVQYKNFFNEVLEPLFYDALALDRSHDDHWNNYLQCKVPFLNGGLFDPIRNYDWVHTDIELPNELFSNAIKDLKTGDIGNGILDIFDRYNFTVKEDEPLEKEVAVDPEMLGKVFENLLEVKDRKSKGTYYTPREIVHYMCQQSLINYLATEFENNIPREEIEHLVKYGELVAENEAQVGKLGKETGTYKHQLSENIYHSAADIDYKLANIKVCDPAIGSGAFPVGMMSEIVKARNVLSNYMPAMGAEQAKAYQESRTIYSFKRDCIQNSLYGVDIDPGAVEIAKLRLWLSLIVDEEDIKEIKPLPNLDYKIMQGNSLLEEYEGVKLFDEKLLVSSTDGEGQLLEDLKGKESAFSKKIMPFYSQNPAWKNNSKLERPLELFQMEKEFRQVQQQIKNYQAASISRNAGSQIQGDFNFAQQVRASQLGDRLKFLHKQFFEESSKSKKDELKKQISDLEWKLIEATLKEQGKISGLKKLEELKQTNTRPFFLWKLNFSEVFQEKGGFDVVIANPPWISNDNIAENEKEVFRKNYEVAKSRFDLANLFVEKALQILKPGRYIFFVIPEHIWLGDYFSPFRRYLSEHSTIFEIISSKETSFEQVSNPSSIFLAKNSKSELNYSLELGTFYDGNYPLKFKSNINIEKRVIFNQFVQQLYNKISGNGFATLNDVALVTDGVQTANILKIIFTQEPKDSKKYHKALRSGKEIRFRYAPIEWTGWWVLKPENTVIYKRPGFSYNSPKRMACFEAKEKIILRQTEPTIFATLDTDQYFFPNSIFQIALEKENPVKLRWLLGFLNSKFLRFLYGKLSQVEGTTKPQIYLNLLKSLPIPMGKEKEISELVVSILSVTGIAGYLSNSEKQAKVQDLEGQIDEMVYKLYGLTEDEIKIIEAKSK